jgi:glycosyltransferase involved in cell wall biosynthesis
VERIPEARLFLVGDGPEKSHLQYLAERMGITGRIIFTGFVPHSKVRDFLREASVFVLPSRFEGLPNALLQAMAAGLPCVATNVGGVPDVIENGINGILIPPGREDLLAEALEKVLIDQDLARRLGENAHRSVSRLRLDRIVGSYHRLIIEMLSIKND